MKIKSSSFDEGKMIPSIYTCEGDNINPPLEFSDVPPNAKSLALIMTDLDTPGGTFTHWLMWNIPPETGKIEENDWLEGAEQGLNDGGELGYMGPCPPTGVHHYHFKLYALNKKLDLSGDVKKASLEREIESGLIEKAELIGIYSLSS